MEDGTSATAAAATTPALDDDDATAVGNTDESVADDAILSSSIAAATAAAPAPAPSTDATTPTTPNSNNRQAQYGVDLDLPSSYVRCGNCQSMFAMTLDDLGARGRRLECSVCGHSWFQSRDRILTVTSEFELLPMLQRDLDRIQTNMDEGKAAKFVGDKKLYVGNISFQSTEDDLFELFGECGDVGEVTLVKDEDGRNRGFGFVTMRTIEGGDLAIAKLDGMAVRGRNMAVRSSNN